jgi:phage FluMu protein Com
MQDFRCGRCRRLLARGDVLYVAIKCPRCGLMNQFQKASEPLTRAPRAPDQEAKNGQQDDEEGARP